jgi:single-strand DNA-binding protein
MNKIVLIGRLTKDPELKFLPGNGTSCTTFTLAVDRNRTSKDGKKETDFVPCSIYGKQADNTANWVTKGKLVGVSGKLKIETKQKDGEWKQYTSVECDEIQFLERNDNTASNNNTNGNSDMQPNSFDQDITPVDDGDIPF